MGTASATDTVRLRLDASQPDGLRLGSPQTAGALTLWPIFTDGQTVEYELLADALQAATAQVSEVGRGEVPRLQLRNAGSIPLLVIEGEVLIGLKQNRVLNTTILVQANSTLPIPVACVQAGRWSGSARPIRSRYSLSPKIRAAKLEATTLSARMGGGFRANQVDVWDRIARSLGRHGVKSTTRSYVDIVTSRGREVEDSLARLRPSSGQTGVLAFAGSEPLFLDLFDQPSTLSKLWEHVVGGYVLDALVDPGPRAPIETEIALRWLRSLFDGDASLHQGIGLGQTVLVAGRGHGLSALVVDGVAVHVVAWPN